MIETKDKLKLGINIDDSYQKILIPGKIKAKERPRTYFNYKKHKYETYTPMNTKSYENLVKMLYMNSELKNIIFKGAVSLIIIIFFSIPDSYTKDKKNKCLKHEIFPTKKPDFDNVVKSVCDGLNKLAYKDDAYITDCNIFKRWSTGGECIEIYIKRKGNSINGY